MNRLSRVFRNLMAAGIITAFGALGGQMVFSSPATAEAGCPMTQCFYYDSTGEPYCEWSYMAWECNINSQTNMCSTQECGSGGSPCGDPECIE